MLPLVSAPVEKLPEPNECPRGALIPLSGQAPRQPTRCRAGDADGAELLPKSIASAHAATGNSQRTETQHYRNFPHGFLHRAGRPVLTLTLANNWSRRSREGRTPNTNPLRAEKAVILSLYR